MLAFGLALPAGLDPFELAHLGLASGLDVDATVDLLIAADSLPSAVLGWTWLVGLIGLIVLGAAVLHGKSAPAWAGAALIAGPLTIPATWFAGSVVAGAAAWVLLVIGFTGCGLTLIDTPARRKTSDR